MVKIGKLNNNGSVTSFLFDDILCYCLHSNESIEGFLDTGHIARFNEEVNLQTYSNLSDYIDNNDNNLLFDGSHWITFRPDHTWLIRC